MDTQSNTVPPVRPSAIGQRVRHLYNSRLQGRVVALPSKVFNGQARVEWESLGLIYHPCNFLIFDGQAFVASPVTADVTAIEETEDSAGVLELGEEPIIEERILEETEHGD